MVNMVVVVPRIIDCITVMPDGFSSEDKPAPIVFINNLVMQLLKNVKVVRNFVH